MNSMKYRALSMVTTLALVSVSHPAWAYEEGISNRSASGCVGIIPSCHNSAMSPNGGAMVRVDGPMMVNAGERVTYTMRIARTDMGTLFGGGFDVRVTGGALGTNPMQPMTRVLDCDLTHTGIIAANAGMTEVVIPFDFIAPGAAGTVQMLAAGNGVDGNSRGGAGGQTGDQWGTTMLSITVVGDSGAGPGGQCPVPIERGPEPTVEPGPEAGTMEDASFDASDVRDSSDAFDVPNEQVVIPIDVMGNDVVADGGPMTIRGGCQCTVSTRSTQMSPLGLGVMAIATMLLLKRSARRR